MRRTLSLLILAAVSAALMLAMPAARADGGAYPSQAPVLASGATVSGGATKPESCSYNDAGKSGVQYYRIPLAFGDHLVVDVTNVATQNQATDVAVLDPGVTDYTISGADSLAYVYTPESEKAELLYIAPAAGNFLLAVSCSGYGSYSWAYSMIVSVYKASSITANGPSYVRRHHKVKITGALSPAMVQNVALQEKKSGVGWSTIAQKSTNADGSYKLINRPSTHGLHKYRVVFGGGGGYLNSKTKKIKVHVS